MTKNAQWQLGRRERQIMDIVFKLSRASVAQVQSELPDPPSYSAVRAMLNFLEDKGHLSHEQDGLRYVYKPTAARSQLRRSALRHVVQTFFDGSYPLHNGAYLYLNRVPGQPLAARDKEFVRFVLSREGQQIVADSRIFIPLSAAQAEAELRKLD